MNRDQKIRTAMLGIIEYLIDALPDDDRGIASETILVARVGGHVRVLAVTDTRMTFDERLVAGKIRAAGYHVSTVRSAAEADLLITPLIRHQRAIETASAALFAIEAPVRRVA
jgi:hypothetical protein